MKTDHGEEKGNSPDSNSIPEVENGFILHKLYRVDINLKLIYKKFPVLAGSGSHL